MTTILEIEKLNVSYQGTSILQNINMKVEKGEILGIVGELWQRKKHFAESDDRFTGRQWSCRIRAYQL